MEEPIRILHVFGGVSLGGAESRTMDLYRNMNREKVQFDFLVHSHRGSARKPEFYDEEIKQLGGNIYVLPKFKVYNYLIYKRAVKEFFRVHNEFKMVQGHMTSTASIYLPAARQAGVRILAAHARSAGVDKGIKGMLTNWMRRGLIKQADICFACSKEAGQAVFGKDWESSEKAVIIPNAIQADKFVFSATKRNEVREMLGVENSFVIGHTGRFHYAKNHEFLIEIFAAFHRRMEKTGKRAVLMLLGEGPGMEKAREQAAELGLTDDILFLGNKKDVENYYQAMDFFVFPSRFEGLPGTVVEAQASGLKCIISDRITPEVGISNLVRYESLDVPPDCWAEYIEDQACYQRTDTRELIIDAGFDVTKQAAKMERFYLTGNLNQEDG